VKHFKWDHLVLDLDGTVYLDGEPIGDVVPRLRALREEGVRVSVMTNNTSLSTAEYAHKVRALGLPVDRDGIFSPVDVAGGRLRTMFGEHPRGYLLGTTGMISQLRDEYGVQHDGDDPQFVLVGFDKDLTYERLQRASEFVNGRVPYYLTHVDLACPTRKGPIPDCGALGAVIRATTGRDMDDHFGKPGRWMAEHVREHLAGDRAVLVAGDRLYTDIALGHAIGADTVLVLSGESNHERLAAWDGRPPTHVADTLAEFLECHSTTR